MILTVDVLQLWLRPFDPAVGILTAGSLCARQVVRLIFALTIDQRQQLADLGRQLVVLGVELFGGGG